MEIDKKVVSDSIRAAELNVADREAKIVTIDGLLAEAKDELDSITAILEYDSRREDRLLSSSTMFVLEGDYGTESLLDIESTRRCRARREDLEKKVAELVDSRALHLVKIAAVRKDLTLLEKILKHRNRHWIDDALLRDY